MTSPDASRLCATLRLAHARNVGPVTWRKLVRVFGSAEAALAAPRSRLLEIPDITARTADGIAEARNDPWAEQEIARATERGVRLIAIEDPHYPRALLSTYDPPIVLYVDGVLLPEDSLSIAIVGSRHCSHYGRAQAEKLAAGLALAGFTVVSGLARGIDSAAHVGALSAERGRTIAVMGNGIGQVYPPENKKLYERIAGESGRGAVLSELPLDTPPAAQHFPGRNRIIAGMTLGTVIVEGTQSSGSLITARYAIDMDREVFAVPGSVDSPNSRGPHSLIKKGAKLVEDVEDILDELREVAEPLVKIRKPDARMRVPESRLQAPAGKEVSAHRSMATPLLDLQESANLKNAADGRPPATDLRAINLNPREKQIYALLDQTTARPVDELIVQSGLQAHEVLATLLVLEVRRLCKQLPGKRYLKA
ncbi:MAG TPA: DNA-processing protein DprA [Planctomycetota bacterium]|nr:DNA-processing protein DprA [Planctomycetota bacterium]